MSTADAALLAAVHQGAQAGIEWAADWLHLKGLHIQAEELFSQRHMMAAEVVSHTDGECLESLRKAGAV